MRKLAALIALVSVVAGVAFAARAGSAGTPNIVAIVGGQPFPIDDSGRVLRQVTDSLAWEQIDQTPPGVLAAIAYEGAGYWAVMQNGDVYLNQAMGQPGSTWLFQGNAIQSPTAVNAGSWSAAKRAFR